MDYAEGIQKALDYIERHLDEELSACEIARQAACSQFYFCRIFGLLCGMTLGEYIRNRRLALAGKELATTDIKVLDVALKYGYESPESFTRAFAKFHGVAPSQVKNSRCTLRSFSPLSVNLILKGGMTMNYKIIDKQAFCVLGKLSTHSMSDGKNNTTVPEFWAQCQRDGTTDRLLEIASDKERVLGICYGQKSDDFFDYSIAVQCDENAPIPKGFVKNKIPARTWAVFECIGAMPNAIQQTWRTIVSEFFPTSGYRPTYEMDIEVYPDGDADSDDYKSEIWVPVQKD